MNRIIVLAIACLAVYEGLPAAEPDDEQQKTLWEMVPDLIGPPTNDTYWPGWIDGNTYATVPFDNREAYVVGVLDGFYFSVAVHESEIVMTGMNDCLTGKTVGQMRNIVDKYHAEHPENWDRPMSETVAAAVFEICPDLKASFGLID